MKRRNNGTFERITRHAEAVKLYAKSKNVNQVAREMSLDYRTVKKMLQECNVTLRSRGHASQIVLENPFKDNPESEYWVGYLMGDGYLRKDKLGVGLVSKDQEIINLYLDFIGYPVNPTLHKRSGCQEVTFGNLETRKFLESWGFTPAKSYSAKFNKSITWHVLRGLFDADGCISKSQWHIVTASKNIVNQVSTFLVTEGFDVVVRLEKTYYRIFVRGGKQGLTALYQKLYTNATYFLSRKKIKLHNQTLLKRNPEMEFRELLGSPNEKDEGNQQPSLPGMVRRFND